MSLVPCWNSDVSSGEGQWRKDIEWFTGTLMGETLRDSNLEFIWQSSKVNASLFPFVGAGEWGWLKKAQIQGCNLVRPGDPTGTAELLKTSELDLVRLPLFQLAPKLSFSSLFLIFISEVSILTPLTPVLVHVSLNSWWILFEKGKLLFKWQLYCYVTYVQ